MGNFKVKKQIVSLDERAAEREKRSTRHLDVIHNLTTPNVAEKKVISAKVPTDTWDTFTAINRAQGMSNNSVLNKLLADYIRKNKMLLSNTK